MSNFTPEITKALAAPLSREHIRQRSHSGRNLSYVEGWHVISEANRIFGFDGWTRQTMEIKPVFERERKIGPVGKQRDGWGVSYVAKVRVIVYGVVRDGTGAGHGIDADLGLAHESAIKEAETDAMKRALMTFGNPFGLALYDKEQSNVSDGPSMSEMLLTAEHALEAAAQGGLESLKSVWTRLDPDLKPTLKTRLDALKAQAAKQDETNGKKAA